MQSMELKDRYVKAWSTFSAEMASLGDDLDRAVDGASVEAASRLRREKSR